MEDKRIIKTKRSLKAAMVSMLSQGDFEHITITELCRNAEVSRITFYSHYNDKYALLDDIFNDMLRIGTEDYYRRQEENNPARRLAAGYVNMLDSILELYYDRFDFFQHTNPEKNPYLASRFYSIVLETVEIDVYKRQGYPEMSAYLESAESDETIYMAVSYTHLDVYKRQGRWRSRTGSKRGLDLR